MRKNLLIIGAGGFAQEVYCWLSKNKYNVIGFISEGCMPGQLLFDVPMLHEFPRSNKNTQFVVAIGDPEVRQVLFLKAQALGFIPCKPIIHSTVVMGIGVGLGAGSILCPGVVVTTDIKMGKSTILNINSTVGHNCYFGDYLTVSPGANISGNVKIGDRCYIGTGAMIREKLEIGDDCTLGMGGVLTRSMPSSELWVGNPAKPMTK